MAIVKEDVSGGYDVSFVDSLEKDYECPICLLAVRDPVQTPCGHSFCKTCFDQVAERQGRGREVECPLDKEKLATSEVFNDMKVRRKVLSLKVKCTNKSSDSAEVCEWIRELNYLQDHHNECRFEIVGCPKDCGNIMQRCDVTNHTIFTCPRRLVTCGSCNMEVEMRDMEQHNSFCPKFSINCMLGCGKKVERIDGQLADC
ncbi:TNF receptor-associated factor 6-like [Corticium candelabrum]|uniref:TNF receptor-associated factor 6-like n=1 Tax=Corticium candelabrum TaxID=121492 RepID=UPI002E26BB7D|nr:TNF receptor-associated factor 6-like [Corticium candelabrum]